MIEADIRETEEIVQDVKSLRDIGNRRYVMGIAKGMKIATSAEKIAMADIAVEEIARIRKEEKR